MPLPSQQSRVENGHSKTASTTGGRAATADLVFGVMVDMTKVGLRQLR